MTFLQTLLDENEAAIRLGITKELLFAYTRYAPKKHLGHTNKLKAVREDKQRKFRAAELDAWDAYLKEPWSYPVEERPPLPAYIDQYLKVECGGQCALCGKGHKLQNAHIGDYAVSFSHHHHNLIRLCTDCHSKFDDNIIPEEEIRTVKGELVRKIRESLQDKKRLFSRATVHRVPRPDPIFIGRKDELLALNDRLGRERVIVVEGVGGIGKTQLVLQALCACKDMPTIWLDVESYKSFGDLHMALLPAILENGVSLPAASSLFDALNKCRLRIVLDGLDRMPQSEWDQVVDFINDLVRLTEHPQILITTQVQLNALSFSLFKIILPPLSIPEGKDLIHIGCDNLEDVVACEDDILFLTDFCDGHSLSLRITIGLLGYYKKSGTVVERLRSVGTEELQDHTRKGQKRSTSLEVCLKAAYSCFNNDQKRLLQYLSNFPAGCLELRAVEWQGASEFHPNLAELRRFFFVQLYLDEWLNVDRIHLLNPVRQFVRAEWRRDAFQEAASIQMEVAEGLMLEASVLNYKYFETSTESEDLQYGLLRIELELPNFIHALRYAEGKDRAQEAKGNDTAPYLEIVAGISFALSKYLFVRGLLNEGRSFIRIGGEAYEKLGRFGPAATQYAMLASMQARMHDYEGHEETTGKLVSLAQSTADPRINALASLSLGEVTKHHRRLQEAARHFQDAASHFRYALRKDSSDDEDDSRYHMGMLGLALKSLGEIYELLKRPEEALPHHLEALEYITRIGDHTNLGVIYHQLGNCYADLGETTKALAAYRKALSSFFRLGYRQYISNAMGEMGKVVAESSELPQGLNEFLSEELINEGLEDVKEEVRMLVAMETRPVEDDVKMLAKLFGIVKLISFTANAGIMKDWAQDFGNEIVAPLFTAHLDDPTGQHESFRRCLNFIINLAFSVGTISREDDQYTEEHVFRLCIVCDLMNSWPASKPFDWLAALLRHHKAYPSVTSKQLQEAIKHSIKFEDRSLFKITDS